jgi:hypothetical protein
MELRLKVSVHVIWEQGPGPDRCRLKEGGKSIEVDDLAQARQTIEELEAELAAVKPASAQFKRGGRREPKRRCQPAEAEIEANLRV